MMGDKLKPCPFCGGEAGIKIHDFFDYTRLYTPRCKCGAGITDVFHTEAEAVAAWNTRAERTCHNDSYRLDTSRFKCSECGKGGWWKDVADGQDKVPSYCPNCGARVVEE